MNYFSQKGEHRVCQYCGMPYVQTRIKQETCGSYKCKKLRKRHLYQMARGKSNIFKIAMTKKCPICGKSFIPKSMNSFLCDTHDCKRLWEYYRRVAKRANDFDKKMKKINKDFLYKKRKRLKKGYFYEHLKKEGIYYERHNS